MKAVLRVLSVTLLLAQLVPNAARAQQASNVIEIRDMSFQPKDLQIDAGETVTWTALEDGHKVTSSSGAWDPSPLLKAGESYGPVEFPEEGTFGYFCSVHGSMKGTIKVGDGCVGDCPVPDSQAPAEMRVVPSLDYPTLTDAVASAPANTLIELRPGTYEVRETIELPAPGVVLRGTNEDGTAAAPGTVVLRGARGAAIGILLGSKSAVTANTPVRTENAAAVENIELTRFLDTAILAEGTRGFRISNVVAHTNVEYGVRVLRSTSGSILDSDFSGHRRAGVSIEECENCDVQVRGVTSHDNFVGIQGRNAGSLIVRESIVRDNASGIVLRSVATEDTRLQRGNHFYKNTVTNNDNLNAPRPSVFALDEALELGSGAGIWIQGGWDDTLEGNAVTDNHYGIVVTASTVPVKDAVVRDNTVSGNGVDLGWDGLGTGVCFQDNGSPTSEPANIQTLYGCSRAVKAGIPYPKVTADLARYAWRSYYCAEVDAALCI